MPINWHLDAEPAPAILVLPPDAASLDEAHAAIELWEFYSGKQLDPVQRLVVEVMMAETADGVWAAATTGREMARQNGKGEEIEVVELWGLVQRAESILHTVHDAVLLASQTQQRMLAVLEHPDLRRKVKRVWKGTGQQMIEMRNGGIVWYRTRSGGGGRGVDAIDRLVVDESQHATDEHLAALAPTMLASPNPQLNILGTGGLFGKSDWWWRIRRRALSADPGRFGYVGHTAQSVSLATDGSVVLGAVDVQDRGLWPGANPSVVSGRSTIEALEEKLLVMGEESFAREHLCVWDPPPMDASRSAKLPADRWSAGAVEVSPHLEPGDVTVAFDVGFDSEWASIGVAAGSLANPYVELVDHRPGTSWLPGRIVELVTSWGLSEIGCNGAGPAGAAVGPVLAALADAGLSVEVRQLGSREYQQACGGIFADVVEGRLSHMAGQKPLDAAASDATDRPLGEAWVWDRRSSTVPISPLVAVTIARALLPVTADDSYDVLASVL